MRVSFDNAYIKQYKNENDRFRNIFSRLQWKYEPKKILDFGCGRGTLSWELTKIFPRAFYCGFDSSIEFIETAQNLNPRHFYTNDFLKLPFDDFDTVFAIDVFNLIEKRLIPTAFIEIRSRMQIGGRIIIHQPRSQQILSSLWKLRFRKYPGGLIKDHELVQLLQQCGFRCDSLNAYTTLFPFFRYREIFLLEKILPNFFLTRIIITACAI